MKIKKCLVSLFALFCSSFFLTNDLNSISAHAQNSPFDFSTETSANTVTISGVEVFEKVTNSTMSEAESIIFSQYDYDFKYENQIPTTCVESTIENNQLIIDVNPFEYTDKNGKNTMWTPSKLSLNGTDYELSYNEVTNQYQSIIPNYDETIQTVDVTYSCNYLLNKEILNEMMNRAYNQAKQYVDDDVIGKANRLYESQLLEYQQQVKKYEKYQNDLKQYEMDNVLYQQYLKDKKEYDIKVDAYNAYLVRYQNYLDEVQRYEQYLIDKNQFVEDNILYQNYLEDLVQYEKDYAKYQEALVPYLQDMEFVNYQLALMELIKTPMTSRKRSIYNAVMGSTVTEVLKRKSELVSLEVPEELIDKAYDSTLKLREIFSEYFALTNDEDKYVYYKSHYGTNSERTAGIKYHLRLLFQCLEKLYRTGLVAFAVDTFDKKPQFLILLAQLAFVCDAIDTADVYTYEGKKNGSLITIDGSSGWKIDGRTVLEILENDISFTIDKSKPYPLRNGYPTEPNEPTPIKEVTKPIEPSIVNEPIAPKEVVKPGDEPPYVAMPLKPSFVAKPEEKPVAPQFDELLLLLVNEYENHILVKREELSEDYVWNVSSELHKQIQSEGLVKIEFYDLSEKELFTGYTDKGSHMVYLGENITKESDTIYQTYAFSHWEYEDGEILDLNHVEKSGKVYPVFIGDQLQKYEVTWNVDGQLIKQMWEYGSTPSFIGSCEKVSDELYDYQFIGWDKEITTVTQNITYTAQYELIRKYYITFKVEDETFSEVYYQGDMPSFTQTPTKEHDLYQYYEFSGWDKEIVAVTDDAVYTAIFKGIDIVSNATLSYGDTSIEVKTNEQEVHLRKLFELVLSQQTNQSLKISFTDGFVELSPLSILQLSQKNVETFKYEYINESTYNYTFNIYLYDNEQNNIEISDLQTTLFGEFDSTHSTIYEVENKQETPIRFEEIAKDHLLVMLQSGMSYRIYPIYNIIVSQTESVQINVSNTKGKIGDEISIEATLLKPGIELTKIVILDSQNCPIELKNGKLIIGTSDYTIYARYADLIYKVEFYSDGELISSKEYKYGEEVVLPTKPSKLTDDQYSYTFNGWDKDVEMKVTKDAVYIATYLTTPVVKDEIPFNRFNIVEIIKIIVIIFLVFVIIALTLIILFILKKKGIILKKKSKD